MRLTGILAICLAMWGCSGKVGAGDAKAQNGADSAVQVAFDADSAYMFVARQTEFGPRVPGSDAHGRCADYLEGELRRLGADSVIVQRGSMTAYDGKKVQVRNILGRFNGSGEKRILLAAHYDSRPWADEEEDVSKHTKAIDGANDGASGVGVLLELARQFMMKRPEAGVDILFVDAEDMGHSGGLGDELSWCLGTQMWGADLPYKTVGERPVYGIVLDMVGGRDAVFYREYVSDRMARWVNDKIWTGAAQSGFSSRFVNEIRGSLIDDHLFINRVGIPCVDIVECGNAETGSFPPTWHTLDDTLENIDRSTLGGVGQVVANVVYGERN